LVFKKLKTGIPAFLFPVNGVGFQRIFTMKKNVVLASLLFLLLTRLHAQNIVSDNKAAGAFPVVAPGQIA
jgi:hypothetical protein